jgi:hypothetical protein
VNRSNCSIQPLRDAAALLLLILVILTVRPDAGENVGDLVPDANAAVPEASLAARPDPGEEPPLEAAIVPGVRVVALDHAPGPNAQVTCRLYRAGEAVEARCTRTVVGPEANRATACLDTPSCSRSLDKG